ncbi:hypothetical protein HPB52_015086 [Rhipicephalus sanguineus]|uniref:THAP-type domain-containing protein n=1 Tax=Rhipicephalus sanguineus TaxID=34632 RepID=A0A9D4SXH7_RHISA|nr:hypothetical protein HPB52_015086 [Rhipicephalus sanguineus]
MLSELVLAPQETPSRGRHHGALPKARIRDARARIPNVYDCSSLSDAKAAPYEVHSLCVEPNGYPGHRVENRRKISLFSVPKEEDRRKDWERNLKRKDKPLAETSAVCEKHFAEHFVIRDYVRVIGGNEVRIPRGRPALAAGAVPTLLPDLPAHLSKVLVKPRPERKRRGVPSSEPAMKVRLSRRDEQEASLAEGQNFDPNARVFENDEVNPLVPGDLQALVDSLYVPRLWTKLITPDLDVLVFATTRTREEPLVFSTRKDYTRAIRTPAPHVAGHLPLANGGGKTGTMPIVAHGVPVFPPPFAGGRCPVRCGAGLRIARGYIGPSPTSSGMSNAMKDRLVHEASLVSSKQHMASLIIDEASMKQKCIYDKKADAVFGLKDKPESSMAKTAKEALENRVLCFELHGTTSLRKIPCSYYITKQLSGRDLFAWTKEVIAAVESRGFIIVRIVTDNYSANVTMFKHMGNGNLNTVVRHPHDANRVILLSFDPCHVLKNVRNQFLERELTDGTGVISGVFVQKLYEHQKHTTVKLARNLTRKHVYPSNLEKMSVLRAVQVFAPHVSAAVEHLQQDSTGDARDFKEAMSAGFTNDTYEALLLTTMSTVETTEFLLEQGVSNVLTKKLNSDPIEAIFGRVRSMCGGNDMLDARAITTALDHINSTGSDRDICGPGYVLKGFESPIHRPERRISSVQRHPKHKVCVLCREVPTSDVTAGLRSSDAVAKTSVAAQSVRMAVLR